MISIHAPSRERHPIILFCSCAKQISIHAPSRERPALLPSHCDTPIISIHAPSRERPRMEGIFGGLPEFQSTLPRGSDQVLFQRHPVTRKFQSTLPRGSDLNFKQSFSLSYNFNPRSLAGATLTVADVYRVLLFQSTLPRGSDVTSRLEELGLKQFQSTLPRGSDRATDHADHDKIHFNPRSLAGATAYCEI